MERAFPAVLGHLVCAYARQVRSIPGRSDRQSAWGSRARTRSPGSGAPVDSLTHWLLTGLPLTSKSEPSKSCLWYLRYRSYKPGTITMRWPTGAGRFKARHCRNAHVPMHATDESASGARTRRNGTYAVMNSPLPSHHRFSWPSLHSVRTITAQVAEDQNKYLALCKMLRTCIFSWLIILLEQ